MKRKILLIILICLFAATVSAVVYIPIKQAITSSAYVAVRLPPGHGCRSFGLWTEDASSFYVAHLSDGSDGILHPDGLPVTIGMVHKASSAGTIIAYVKGTTSTNVVGHFTWKPAQ